jgi:hypothetical protein
MRLFRRKCYICRTRRVADFGTVPKFGIYGELRRAVHYFHTTCLVDVLEAPEVYGHAYVDRALFISDQIRQVWEKDDKAAEFRRTRVAKAREALLWAPIPTDEED